ncbi:MAG: hypothetical protein EXR21_06820 [Flavobacteriaceae bacterium]|nr:hypothetical protein [Flavobacteriaceae bacterium]
MENQELELLLETLKKDLIFYKPYLKETATEMMAEEFTKHPIFIASQQNIRVGKALFDRKEFEKSWSINATTLSQLIELKAIDEDKEADFRNAFKDPETHMCILMLVPKAASFVFVPY